MKVTIQFVGDETKYELKAALLGTKLATCLRQLEQHVHMRLKHGELTSEARAELTDVKDYIPWELLQELEDA